MSARGERARAAEGAATRRPPAYTAGEVAALAGGRVVSGPEEAVVQGAAFDSRRVAAGEAFAAIRGERTDGHLYLRAAAARGASALLVSRWGADLAAQLATPGDAGAKAPDTGGGPAVILVEDTVAALGRWAAGHRSRFSLPVIGITGSVGKTTAKDMAAHILGSRFDTLATEGNLNTDVSLPVMVLRVDGRHQVGVLEMATRGEGQLRYLAKIARPAVGVITEIVPVHLETLGSIEGVARAKAELLRSLPEDGVALVCADSGPLARELANCRPAAPVVTFGLGPRAAVRAVGLRTDFRRERRRMLASVSFSVEVRAGAAPWLARTPARIEGLCVPHPGRRNVQNVLAAALAAAAVGVPLAEGLEALGDFSPRSSMRLDLRVLDGLLLIDDAYNANPASMEASLEILGEAAREFGGRRLAVLGDMLELGPAEEQAHKALGRQAADAGVDALVGVGPASELVVREAVRAGIPAARARHTLSHRAAAAAVLDWARAGDTVLVKGSRGMALENVVRAIVEGWRG